MKKKILLIILLLVPFMVQAKESFAYKWDIIPTSPNYIFAEEQPSGYTFIKPSSHGRGAETTKPVIMYDKSKGTVVKSYDTFEQYLDVYSEKESKENLAYASAMRSGDLVLTVGDETVYIDVTDGDIEICTQVVSNGGNDSAVNCTEGNVYEMSDADMKKYTGKYYFIFKKHQASSNSYQYGYYIPGGYYFLTISGTNQDDANVTFDLYLEDGSKPFTATMTYADIFKGYYVPTITSNAIYVLKPTRDYDNAKISYVLTKYDRSGNKLFSEDITSLIRQTNNINSSHLIAYDIQMVNSVEGGLIIKLEYNETADRLGACMASPEKGVQDKSNPSDGKKYSPRYLEEEEIDKYEECVGAVVGSGLADVELRASSSNHIKFLADDELPEALIMKLGIEYEITTKVKGNGSIKVVSTAPGGEGVTFVVEPQKGYVLGEVKVTDEFGNVLTFKNNTFTMPSSNVLIEATFIVNPDTGAFIPGLIVMGALLLACVILFVSEKNQKIKTIS